MMSCIWNSRGDHCPYTVFNKDKLLNADDLGAVRLAVQNTLNRENSNRAEIDSVRNLSNLCRFKRLYSGNSDVINMAVSQGATIFQCEVCQACYTTMSSFVEHTCAHTEQPQPASPELRPEPSSWNRAQTLLLIDLYQQFEKDVSCGKLRKKTMWEKIGKNMSEAGHIFTADQIAGRWKSLLRAYKNIKDNNKKSGAAAKNFEFEKELDELLKDDPAIKPRYLLSSMQKRAQDDETVIDEGECAGPSSAKKVHAGKTTGSSNSQVVDLLKTFMEDQKVERAKIHSERMGLMSSLVMVLKDIGGKKEGDQ